MSQDAPTRYPLAWPAGRPRKKGRGYGNFKSDGGRISVSVAIARLTKECEMLRAQYPLLSSDLRVRLDGSPILNQGMPTDPGACLYFQLKGKPFALACDTYTELAQNIAALAAHIEATRRIERYGVASAAETLQAFSALPPPPPGGSVMVGLPPARPWYEVLGLSDQAGETVVQAAFRALIKEVDPNGPKMRELIEAREGAMRAIRSRDVCGND